MADRPLAFSMTSIGAWSVDHPRSVSEFEEHGKAGWPVIGMQIL